jgi:hypothetical protein
MELFLKAFFNNADILKVLYLILANLFHAPLFTKPYFYFSYTDHQFYNNQNIKKCNKKKMVKATPQHLNVHSSNYILMNL